MKIFVKKKRISKKSGSFFSVFAQLRAICDGDSRCKSNSKVLKAYETCRHFKEEKVAVFSYLEHRALETI